MAGVNDKGPSITNNLHADGEVEPAITVHTREEEDLERMDCDHMNDFFAKFQQTMRLSRSALVHITGEASNAESVGALHQKLKKEYNDAFIHYISFCQNNFDDWASVIEKFSNFQTRAN